MDGAETVQIVFEHEYMFEHEQAEAIMDTKLTEVKNTTNNLDNEKYEFKETKSSCGGMIWAGLKIILEMIKLDYFINISFFKNACTLTKSIFKTGKTYFKKYLSDIVRINYSQRFG